MAWMHQKPDANGLQNDASFYDLVQMPLINNHARLTSAFDPYSNTITAPGVLRQRVAHIGVKSHELILNENASSTIMLVGSSDGFVGPLWNTVSNCNCAQDGTDPGGLPTFILTPTTTNGIHYYGQTVAFPAGNSVLSFYVKANGYTGLGIGLWDQNSSTYLLGNIDLTTGISSTSPEVFAESLDGGWYRIWCARSFGAGTSSSSNFSINIGSNISTFTYAGDGISGILVTQPSIEPGLVSPTSWISSRNTCPYSTDVSDGSWGPEQLTVTAHQALDPLSGIMTAALLTEDSTSNIHVISQNISVINGSYICHSAYYKPTGRTWILINNGPTGKGCWFNCAGSGTVGSPNGAIVSSGITALSGPATGWYRCWFTSQAGTSNNIQAYTSTGDTISSYLGTGTSCGYIANFQAEPVGNNITPYPDAANIILSAANLADVTYWNGGAIIGVSSFTTDPNGGTNAFTITNGSGGIYDALFQPITTLPTNGPVLISFYIKHGNTTASAIQIYDTTANAGRGILEVVWTGSVVTSVNTLGSGLTTLGCGYIALQNGWYRILALSATGIITSNANGIYIYPGQPGFQSAGNFCYGYGPQVTALAPTPYWGNHATVGGRDQEVVYADISSIIDSRLNLIAFSEQLDQSGAWTINSASVTANAGTDPNGNAYADDLVEASGGLTTRYAATSSAVLPAGSIVFIARIKPIGRTWCNLQVYDTGSGTNKGNFFGLIGSGIVGSALGAGVTTATITGPDIQGYYRCVIILTLVGSSYGLIVTASADTVQDVVGSGVSALRIFGVQAVVGSVDPGPDAYLATHAAVTLPQVGLSTTAGSVIALGIPYTGNVQSGNYYSHVGNTDFVMDPGGQFYRGANGGGAIHETIDVLDMAIMTWNTLKDVVFVYNSGTGIGFANLGQDNCPLNIVGAIPIGWQFSGTGNYNGWVSLMYAHGRSYNVSECISLAKALENA